MNQKFVRGLGIFMIISCLALTGCMNNDGDRTRAEGAGVGAAGGALGGALLGQLFGGSTTSTLVGAAIGAGVGAGAGYLYGDHVAGKKAEYASNEDWLNACIDSSEKAVANAKNYNSSLDEDLVSLETQIARLESDKLSVNEKATLQKNTKELLAEDTKMTEKAIASLKTEIAAQTEVVEEEKSGAQVRELNTQIAALNKELDALESNQAELAALSVKMSV